MKLPIVTAVAVLSLSGVRASESPSLRFGGEQIGVPPLSLAESMTRGMPLRDPAQFRAEVPQFARGRDSTPPPLSLVPRAAPGLRQLEAERHRSSPRVSSTSGMPIVEPREDIDYKLKIVAPNPAIDFKLAIKDPANAPEAAESK